MTITSSTLASRAMGRELRRLRIAKGIGQSQAARVAELSPQSIGRLEEGQNTRITSFQINALCDAYAASDDERRVVLDLAREARAAREGKTGWWRAYLDNFTEDFNHYLALEEAAAQITSWSVSTLPGLLQTSEYRRAIAWAEAPNAPAEEIEKRIEWATKRQARLAAPDFTAEIFLSEGVLRSQVGGRGVMKNQACHLAGVSEMPNVSIYVVPFDARSIVGLLAGPFTFIEFPPLPHSKSTESPIIYVEGYAGDLYLERAEEIERYQRALAEIRRVSLDQGNSREFILAVAREYGE
ncbi:helix-turn-helix domain-containing protein [Nocardia miyunensis]|uniref:helix-turn-helix domain-containing protein n=1 Tax=Nocardia miyunensis TaxID=282684 RepID=UPI0009FFFA2F|nr:helix-turn-helix transcriptional regulator [Nocardia miyunensis]